MTGAELTETVRQSMMTWKQPAGENPSAGGINLVMAAGSSQTADHSLLGVVASSLAPAKSIFAPPGRQTMPPPRAEVVNASESVPETPYQAKPVQTVGYQTPATRAWPADTEAKPTAPTYQVPTTRAWSADAEAKPAALLHQAPATRAWPADAESKPVDSSWKSPAAKPVQASAVSKTSPPTTHYPPATGMDVGQMLKVLRDGTHSEQRVWAAAELANVDGRGNPDVIDALVATAQIDASASVRLQCVRTLVKMNVGGTAVHELLESLQSDADASVQLEARRALGKSKN